MTIPEVKEKEGLITKPLKEVFWKKDGIAHLEEIRKGIRNLVKYIDPSDQKYVTTDFEDSLDESQVTTNDYVSEPPITFDSPFTNNLHRLKELIRANKDNLTISRIRKGETITERELQSLETILFTGGIKKVEIEKEIGEQFNLVPFVISLMGLSADRVDEAFANFINLYQLNSVQIQFLDTIKLFLTKNGKIDPTKLYDSPFRNYHSMGIDGVFDETQADTIFEIIQTLNGSQSV